MKRSTKITIGIVTSIGLGLAVAAHAHPGGMGSGMQQGMMGGMGQGGMQQGMMGGMNHGDHGTMGRGAMGQGIASQLMTPEEQAAMRAKMSAAKTPEERQQIAAANHAEMQKRAKDKGITLPDAHAGRDEHAGHGMRGGPATPPAAK